MIPSIKRIAFASLVTSLIILGGCVSEGVPEDILRESIQAPANSGVTVKSDYVQEPTYMYEPVEWSVLELNITEQKVNGDNAEVVTESKIENDDFEVRQTLKQYFKKTEEGWTLENTERIDSLATALAGINYAPSSTGVGNIYIADLPDAEIEFDKDMQTCTAFYPVDYNEADWFVKQMGYMSAKMSFDGIKWNVDSRTFEGDYYTPFGGSSIEGRRPNTTESAFEYYLGSSRDSNAYEITFDDVSDKDMTLTFSWSGTRYVESDAEKVGGYTGLMHSGEGVTTSFSSSAQYSGEYDLGSSNYGFGDDEPFTLKKVDGDSNMPSEITCVFKYPDRSVSTRVFLISWEENGTTNQAAFDLMPV